MMGDWMQQGLTSQEKEITAMVSMTVAGNRKAKLLGDIPN